MGRSPDSSTNDYEPDAAICHGHRARRPRSRGAVLPGGHRGAVGRDGHAGLRVLRPARIPATVRATSLREELSKADPSIWRLAGSLAGETVVRDCFRTEANAEVPARRSVPCSSSSSDDGAGGLFYIPVGEAGTSRARAEAWAVVPEAECGCCLPIHRRRNTRMSTRRRNAPEPRTPMGQHRPRSRR